MKVTYANLQPNTYDPLAQSNTADIFFNKLVVIFDIVYGEHSDGVVRYEGLRFSGKSLAEWMP